MRARKAYDFWCRLMEIVFKLGHVSRDYGVHGTRADRTTVDASCSCLPYLQQTLLLSSHKPQPFRDGSGTSALPVEHPAERGTGQANKGGQYSLVEKRHFHVLSAAKLGSSLTCPTPYSPPSKELPTSTTTGLVALMDNEDAADKLPFDPTTGSVTPTPLPSKSTRGASSSRSAEVPSTSSHVEVEVMVSPNSTVYTKTISSEIEGEAASTTREGTARRPEESTRVPPR